MLLLIKGLFTILLVSSAIHGNDEYHIEGVVTDTNGEPISAIRVELYNHQDELIAYDSTSATGEYQFTYTPTSIDEAGNTISEFKLGEAYPNPIGRNSLSSTSQIPIQISEGNNYQIEVFTITGQLVTRTQQSLQPGAYTVNVGLPEAAGVYLVRVTGNGINKVRKITSMAGTHARININPGGDYKSENFAAKQSASNQGLTIRAIGGAHYIGQEVQISTPGTYTRNFTLQPQADFSCEDIELSAMAAKPSVMVNVTGITKQLGEEPKAKLAFNSNEPDEEVEFSTYIERINENEAEFLVPVHPINHMDGGEAELIITSEDESITCAGTAFTIDSMEPAPGLLSQSVDELETAFEELAKKFGLVPDELRAANINELDGFHKSIAAGLQMIGGEDLPNNLRNILNGSAPALQDYEDDELFEVVEAVLAVSGFDENVSTFSEEIINASVHHEYDPNAITGWPDQQQNKKKSVSLPDNFATPKELDELMAAHNYYAGMNTGTNHEIREFTGLALGSVSVTTGLVGAAPVSAAAGLSAMAVTAMQMALEIAENTLPSELQAMELSIDPEPDFLEETAEPGAWEATITARSKGWTLDYPTLLSNIPGMGKFSTILRKSNLISEMSEEMADLMVDIFQTYYTTIREENESEDENKGPITIDPQEWGIWVEPGRDNEEQYFHWSLETVEQETGIEPFELGEGENAVNYSSLAVGKSKLMVRTQNDKFLGQHRTDHSFMEIKKIGIAIQEYSTLGSRSVHRIGKEENYEIEFWAELEHAVTKEVEWELTVEEGEPPISFGPELTTEEVVKLVAPNDLEEQAMYTITATSLAKEGLRGKDHAPERKATTTVIVEPRPLELTVTPDPACVELDMTPPPFTAYLDTDEIPVSELSHQIDGPGMLSAAGAYQPTEEGFVNITFTYELPDSDRQATAEVHFMAREECGQISVESSEFSFTTEYASAEVNDIDEYGGENFSSFYGTMLSGPETIIVSTGTEISDEGEWTREFFWTTGSPDPNWWQIPTFVDANGDEWAVDSDEAMVADDNNIKLTITRTEETFEGVQLGIFDGEFTLPFRNETALSERDEDITTVITGQIQAIPLDVGPTPEPPN